MVQPAERLNRGKEECTALFLHGQTPNPHCARIGTLRWDRRQVNPHFKVSNVGQVGKEWLIGFQGWNFLRVGGAEGNAESRGGGQHHG